MGQSRGFLYYNMETLILGAGSYSENNPLIKGIGTCLVERFAKEGYSPILFTYCNSQNGASELIRTVRQENPFCEIEKIKFDSLKYKEEWINLEKKLNIFGTPDIFVYNSGLRFYKKELSDKEKQETMCVNYYCSAFLIEKIANRMIKEQKKGKIIVTSSILAGQHHEYLKDYCLSKVLLNKFIQDNFELYFKKGIKMGIVSPNITRTPMTEVRIGYYEDQVKNGKLEKIFSSEEIAREILELCLK